MTPTLTILDTDSLSLFQRGHPGLQARLAALPPECVFITIVSVKEQMRGRLAQINSASDAASMVNAYRLLGETLESLKITFCPLTRPPLTVTND